MNRLTNEDRCRVLACLVEGNSIRATVRITGIAKKTVQRLGVELGEACEKFADKVFRNLTCERIQCDEIWSFCYAKDRNVPADLRHTGAGDVWTWVAIDPDTKLIPCWYVANDRTAQSAYRFMRNLQPRLANRIQLSTDGLGSYVIAIKAAFLSAPVDYGMLVKLYENTGEGKYSPGQCTGARREAIFGNPKAEGICTSHSERQNLTMRMQMRRFTRLTNGFSKKLENHRLACAVHFIHYNFARIHSSIRVTPAMAAGISDHVWELSEIVNLLEAEETVALTA